MNDSVLLNPYKSRWYSAFKWMIGGNVVLILAFICLPLIGIAGAFLALLTLLVPPACFIYGFCRPTPYASAPRVTERIGVGIFWTLTTIPGIFAMAGIVTVLMILAPTRTRSFEHANFAAISAVSRNEYTRKLIGRLIPTTATDITLHGNLGPSLLPGGQNAQFSCALSEEDFLAFAKTNDYPLAENDPCGNANPRTGKNDWTSILPLSGKTLPASYWSYANIYSNCGGIFLLYDRTAHRLYGAYSSN